MIIENQEMVTTAVLDELKRAPNARFREVMGALVRHLHDFAREVKLPKYATWQSYETFLAGNVERYCRFWAQGN